MALETGRWALVLIKLDYFLVQASIDDSMPSIFFCASGLFVSLSRICVAHILLAPLRAVEYSIFDNDK